MLAVKVSKLLHDGEGQRLQRRRVTPEKSGKTCLHFCPVSEVKETERVKSKSCQFEVGTPKSESAAWKKLGGHLCEWEVGREASGNISTSQ